MSSFKDLTGIKYGRLTPIGFSKNKNNKIIWKCKCDCGNIKEISANQLRSGKTKSCGCLRREVVSLSAKKMHTKHGNTNSRLYNIWRSIKKRCNLKSHNEYMNYGGRGIKICNEWLNDFVSFYNWAINNGYKENLTIDRINNNGNYEPNNCRWITMKEQQNNKRNNIHITFNNETKSIYDWCKIFNIKYCTLWWRLKNGWTIEEALLKKARR